MATTFVKGCRLSVPMLLILPVVALAGHNREDREAEIRAKFDWVVFDGEFSAANVAAYALESYFLGGEITQDTLKKCAEKMGRDVVGEMVKNGFDPARDRVYSGLMVFENWQDLPFNNKLPLPNKFVPYVAVRRGGGGGGGSPGPGPGPGPVPTNPNYVPDSAPPNAGFSHVLFRVSGVDGMNGFFSVNTDRTRDMWFHYESRPNGPPYSGWFTGRVVSQFPGDPNAFWELTPVNHDYNSVRILINQDRVLYRSDGINFTPHPIVSGRWDRNPWRSPDAFK